MRVGMKTILWLGGAVAIGTFFSKQIKSFLVKLPVIGEWISQKTDVEE